MWGEGWFSGTVGLLDPWVVILNFALRFVAARL
jgi:hypothetical protein